MAKIICKTIIDNNKLIAQNYYEVTFEASAIAKLTKPGNFLQIKVTNNLDPLLPRPLGIAGVKGDKISVIYQVAGRGTQMLADKKVGDALTVTGPLGNSFWLEDNVKRMALVAGGTGVGPILFLAKCLNNKPSFNIQYPISVFIFLGNRSKNLICQQDILKQNCEELLITTDDGSCGEQGFITDILEDKCRELKIDQMIAVGPTPMMEKAVKIASKLKIHSLVSLEERMACGFGVCLGCAVKLKDNQYHKVCTDGPIFRGDEVIWE